MSIGFRLTAKCKISLLFKNLWMRLQPGTIYLPAIQRTILSYLFVVWEIYSLIMNRKEMR